MKKLIAILAVAVTGFTSFAQGYFSFTGGSRAVWDDFSGATPKFSANMNVGFLWGVSGTALITSLASSIATNVGVGNLPVTTAQAWNAILNDANYHVAVDSGTSSTVITPTLANNGSFSYPGTFGVTGTSVGATYNIIEFAWNNAYATPALAAAAGAAVGWGNAFAYTTVASTGTPLSMTSQGALPFGVASAAPVPEPATIALAGLGGLSLLALRRRKSK